MYWPLNEDSPIEIYATYHPELNQEEPTKMGESPDKVPMGCRLLEEYYAEECQLSNRGLRCLAQSLREILPNE
jgi:hypothetical protein